MRLINNFKARLNSVQVKSFILHLGVSMVAMTILVMLLYILFQNKSREDINSITKSSLVKVDYMMVSTINSIKNFTLQIHNDNNFTQLIMSKERDVLNEVRVTSTLNNVMLFSPYIYSVFICNDNSVIMRKYNNSDYNIESDGEVLKLISSTTNLKPVFRQVKNNYGKNVDVYSIIYKFTFGNKNSLSGALVINVNADLFSKYIVSNVGDIFIIDSYGNVILHKDKNMFLKNLSNEAYVKSLLTSGETYGSFNALMDNQKYAIDFMRVEEYGYYIISKKPYSMISKELSVMRNYIIIIFIVILPILYAGFLFISNSIFNPITEIVNNIRKHMKFEEDYAGKKGENEINFISTALLKVIKHVDNLEMKEKDNLFVLANNFMDTLLTKNTNFSKDEIEEKFLQYNIAVDLSKPYFIVVLRIDDFKTFCDENTGKARNLVFFSMGNIAEELLGEEFDCSSFQIGDEHLVIIANIKDFQDIEYKKIIIPRLEVAQGTIRQYMNVGVTIGVSDVATSGSLLKDMYLNAFNCTNYRLFYGKSHIFSNDKLKTNNYDSNFKHGIGDILAAVKHGEKERYLLLLDEELEKCRECSYSIAVKRVSQLMVSISAIPADIKPGQDFTYKIDLIEANGMIRDMQSPEEIKELLIKLFDNVYGIISKVNSTRIQDVIGQIIEYVNENYADPQISANSISGRFSITLQYFSSKFNEFTGEGFPSYLNRLRLEKAREMLLTTDLDASVISKKVGYSNRSYFTTLFKNEYAVSPARYRAQGKR